LAAPLRIRNQGFHALCRLLALVIFLFLHASVNTTENFYSHIIEENKAKAADCIANVLIRKKA
jgi:hypothetical protein